MSDIQCCPLWNDGEGPDAWTVVTPKARKEHSCCECREPIPVGATYEKTSGIWDGRGATYKTCLSCVEIRDHFACNGGWVFEHVWEQLEESFFPGMAAGGPCMDGLSPAAKGRLFTRRLAWLER